MSKTSALQTVGQTVGQTAPKTTARAKTRGPSISYCGEGTGGFLPIATALRARSLAPDDLDAAEKS